MSGRVVTNGGWTGDGRLCSAMGACKAKVDCQWKQSSSLQRRSQAKKIKESSTAVMYSQPIAMPASREDKERSRGR